MASVPHYHAVRATSICRTELGDMYRYDPTPPWVAMLLAARDCVYVNGLRGRQFYRKFASE